MLLIEIESVEEIKSSEITWRNQNQLIMPTCKFLFLILYLLFKNAFFQLLQLSCKRKTFSIFFWQIIFKERNLIFQNQNVRKVFTVYIISYFGKAVLSEMLSTPMSVDPTPTLQHHQKHYNYFFYYSEVVEIKRPLFYFYLYLIFLLCFFKKGTWWWRNSAAICAVSSTKFETPKLNSNYDKFCLDHSLSNFNKALLDNNTFA